MSTSQTILSAAAKLFTACDGGSFSDEQHKHIVRVLLALAEKPNSVQIETRSLFHQAWEDIKKYLSMEKKGYILIILEPKYWFKRDSVERTLGALGFSGLFTVTQPDSAKTLLKDRDKARKIRLVVYTSEISNKLKDLIDSDTSVELDRVDAVSIRKKLVFLSGKLNLST